MIRTWASAAAAMALAMASAAAAQKVDFGARVLASPSAPGKATLPFVSMPAGHIALAHVRVIDGTGAPAQEDRTILIDGARITRVQDGSAAIPPGYDVRDLTGRSVMPGIVGMHDHQYYIARPQLDAAGGSEPPLIIPEMAYSSPRLYLANGVTTLRTTGSVEPYTDLNMKAMIDAGTLPGPHMDVTAPYLEGQGSPFLQMHQLTGPEDARRMVGYWADLGATSFKAYMNITRAELKAAIDEAHRRGLKLTGHLCSVTYPEAAALGIDNLEHGFFVNTQNDPGKLPDRCPATDGQPTLSAMNADTAAGKALIRLLVDRKVAVTSTLPVFEPQSTNYRALGPKVLAVLTPEARTDYLYVRNLTLTAPAERRAARARMYDNNATLERAFVAAGGLLLAGPDPTGGGNVLPGFGDQRAIELLVGEGFTPLEAIRIGTLNGATYMGLADRIGSIAPGKQADLVVVAGDPSRDIDAIEAVETVFKDGVGYDSGKLLESVRGAYGRY